VVDHDEDDDDEDGDAEVIADDDEVEVDRKSEEDCGRMGLRIQSVRCGLGDTGSTNRDKRDKDEDLGATKLAVEIGLVNV
jgi:hypothetical protein